MTKDESLEKIFLTQKPVFNDQDIFLQKLERKLEAVEFIKQYEEAHLRRYKYAMIAAFVLGIVSGGVSLMLFLSYAVIGIINSILDIKSFYELRPRQAVE